MFASMLPLVIASGVGADSAQTYAPGAAFDIAPFGSRMTYEPAAPLRVGEGKAHGVRWAEPRKVRRVVVEFAEGQILPEPRRSGWSTGVASGTARPIL
jgi:hypothetical protein